MIKLRNTGLLSATLFVSGAVLLISFACSSSPSEDKDSGNNAKGGGSANPIGGNDAGDGSGGTSGEATRGVTINGKVLYTDEYGLITLTDAYDGGLEELLAGACQGETVETEPEPVDLQLVIDTSSSMNRVAPNTSNNASKWSVTVDALSNALATLPPNASVGLTFYPNEITQPNPTPDGGTPNELRDVPCINTAGNVPIAMLGQPDDPQRSTIETALRGIVIPDTNAGTPTHDAYMLALDPLQQANLPADQKFMLLITDGQPTFSRYCVGWGAAQYAVNEQPIVDAISAAYDNGNGIRTFVIGSPGSEKAEITNVDTRGWLSRAATAGGTAKSDCSDSGTNYCHFDMSTSSDFSAGLTEALRVIASTIVSCNYTIKPTQDGTPIDPDNVNIVFSEGGSGSTTGTDYLVARNKDPACPNGWRFTDDASTEIEICGSTCEKIKNDPKAKMNLVYGCKDVVTVE